MIEIKNKQGEVIYTYNGINLYDADLRHTNLYGAVLSGANLCGADLSDTNLYGADLRGADLSDTNLCCADLRNANLYDAILYGANLRCANLYGAVLSGADLCRADLRHTNLWRAITEFGSIKSIMQISNIGSRKDTTVVYHTERGIFIKCGCFKGPIAEFEEKVKETHQGNNYEKAYLAMIELVKVRFQYE